MWNENKMSDKRFKGTSKDALLNTLEDRSSKHFKKRSIVNLNQPKFVEDCFTKKV